MKIPLTTNNYPLSVSPTVWVPFEVRELALALTPRLGPQAERGLM